MVPGLMGYIGGMPAVTLTSATTDLHISALLGYPTDAVEYVLYVAPNAVIYATNPDEYAIWANGLHADSIGHWKIDGYVLGAGGAGGKGKDYSEAGIRNDTAPGGGGGAGKAIGAGAVGNDIYTDAYGADGTDTSNASGPWPGGAGGDETNMLHTLSFVDDPTPGTNGGHAIRTNHTIIIDMLSGTGRLWGGGGGGGGAWSYDATFGRYAGVGGGPGEAGSLGTPITVPPGAPEDTVWKAGDAGRAAQLNGGSVTINAADIGLQVKGAYT